MYHAENEAVGSVFIGGVIKLTVRYPFSTSTTHVQQSYTHKNGNGHEKGSI